MKRYVIYPAIALFIIYLIAVTITYIADHIASNPFVISFPAVFVLIAAGAFFLE